MNIAQQHTDVLSCALRGIAYPLRGFLISIPIAMGLSLTAPSLAQTPVVVFEATSDAFTDRIEALGTLRANEEAEISASVTEIITEIRFSDGQRVSQGELLVAMTNRQQLAELEAAEAELDEARRQFERVQELQRQGTESATVLDIRRREMDTARARLHQVEARLEDRLVTAPFDGVVGLRNVSVGTLLSPGTAITTLIDDRVMKLDFSVPELFLRDLQVGVEIVAQSPAWPGHHFEGVVTSIDNRVDPVTRAIGVRAEIPNEDRRLRPGMLMTLILHANRRESAVIPEEAVISLGHEHFLFVINDNDNGTHVSRRRVDIGTRRAGEVEIVGGLQVNERVVTHGGFQLSDGQAVMIQAVAARDAPLSDYLAGEN